MRRPLLRTTALAAACAALFALGTAAPGVAHAEPWSLAFEAGGQVDSRPFGVVNVALERGPLALRLLTDTLEVELGGAALGGRAWGKVRAQAFASQLLIGPWTDGEPDPARALYAPHVGAELGWVRYLPGGLYAGGTAFARAYGFFATPSTRVRVPDPTWWVSFEAVAGWWRSADRRVLAHGGVDLGADGVAAPKAAVEAILAPDAVVAPRLEVYAGWARRQPELFRTRLGGLNPYVVPLAGAGWAEHWVETYAVVRVGPQVRWKATREVGGLVAAVADLATFDGEREVGLALVTRTGLPAGWFVDVRLGVAPWIERAPGVSRVSGWLLVGRGLRPVGSRRDRRRARGASRPARRATHPRRRSAHAEGPPGC